MTYFSFVFITKNNSNKSLTFCFVYVPLNAIRFIFISHILNENFLNRFCSSNILIYSFVLSHSKFLSSATLQSFFLPWFVPILYKPLFSQDHSPLQKVELLTPHVDVSVNIIPSPCSCPRRGFLRSLLGSKLSVSGSQSIVVFIEHRAIAVGKICGYSKYVSYARVWPRKQQQQQQVSAIQLFLFCCGYGYRQLIVIAVTFFCLDVEWGLMEREIWSFFVLLGEKGRIDYVVRWFEDEKRFFRFARNHFLYKQTIIR